jgi:hypothetical protein
MVPSSAAQGGPPETFTSLSSAGAADTASTAAGQSCLVTLPGGLRAAVTGQAGGLASARPADPAQVHEDLLTYHSGGHEFLVPVSAMRTAATTGLTGYDTTALAQRACPDGHFAATSSASAAASAATTTSVDGKDGKGAAHPAAYTMARLTLHLLTADGTAPIQGSVLLSDVDNGTYVAQILASGRSGTIKISVPAGHYSAVFIDTDEGRERLTMNPDFTVRGDTGVTLDTRTSTVTVPVPATPRAAVQSNTSLDIYRSDGTASGNADGLLLSVQRFSPTPTDLTVNTTGPAEHGRFEVVSAFELDSPAGTPQPYAYHLADSFDRLPHSYPTSVAASSLATVERGYATSAGLPGSALVVDNITPTWAATDGLQVTTAFEVLPTGATRTEYFSGVPDLNWRTQIEDQQTLVDYTGRDAVYRAGQHLSEVWDAGALHPSGQLDEGSSAVYCGACATKNMMIFGIGSNGDTTPGTLGAPSTGETNTVTLRRNGKLYSTGEEGLYETSTTVPTGRARYELQLSTARHLTSPLSPSTDTTWTFTADPGHGKAVPGHVHCAGPADSCAALPLLYARTDTDADLQDQLTAGRHTLSLTVAHQQYAVAPPVSGAEVSVSYDAGASWHKLHVSGRSGSYRADYTVPASASGGTVSFRLSAWDGQGNRIDQTLPSAYEVR